MAAQQIKARVLRFKAAIDALEKSRQAVLVSCRVGLPEVEAALEAQRALLGHALEEVAADGWWHSSDLPHLFEIVDISRGLLGLVQGGPVFRIAAKLGELCKEYAEPIVE